MALFGDTEIVAEYEIKNGGTKCEQFTCTHCGRQFSPYLEADGSDDEKMPEAVEKARQSLMLGCPSNDCPSHWEAQGLANPEHDPEGDPERGLLVPDESKLKAAGYSHILH